MPRSLAARPSRWLLVAMVAALPMAACESARNKACEPCSNAEDCEMGLTCQVFGNGQTLCGDANVNMVCPPR